VIEECAAPLRHLTLTVLTIKINTASPAADHSDFTVLAPDATDFPIEIQLPESGPSLFSDWQSMAVLFLAVRSCETSNPGNRGK
jgi:hypothetical protein